MSHGEAPARVARVTFVESESMGYDWKTLVGADRERNARRFAFAAVSERLLPPLHVQRPRKTVCEKC